MIPSQCSLQQTSQKSLKSYSIYKNSCFHLQSESKLNFIQSVDFCKEKGFEVIHNRTNDGGLSYLFARSNTGFKLNKFKPYLLENIIKKFQKRQNKEFMPG